MELRITFKLNNVLVLAMCAVCFLPQPVYGQFDKILKKTTRKLGNEVERMAVDKASDIIARQLAKKMEESFDEWLVEAAKRDTSFHYEEGDSSAYRMGKSYGEFLRGMNDAADLPPSYHFDLQLIVEIQSGKEDAEQMLLMYSKDEPVFAMQSSGEKDNTQVIVLDADRDVTVLYREEKGEKTAQALPSFSNIVAAGADQVGEFEFEKTGKKEKIAGYRCDGYRGSSDTYQTDFWITDEVDINWNESFAKVMQKFGGESYANTYSDLKGITLKALSWEKGKEKDITRWETLEVINEDYEIVNADYQFGNQN